MLTQDDLKMSENQPEKGQLLSRTCHWHLQTGLGILTKAGLHNSNPVLKGRMLPSLWRCRAVLPSQYPTTREGSLIKKLFFCC